MGEQMEMFRKYNIRFDGRSIRVDLEFNDKRFYALDILRSILIQYRYRQSVLSETIFSIQEIQKRIKLNDFLPSDSGFVYIEQNECTVYDMYASQDAAEAGGEDEAGDAAIPLLKIPTDDFILLLKEWVYCLEIRNKNES